MWSKPGKKTRLLILLCAAALIVLGAVLAIVLSAPYRDAKNTMDPEGMLFVRTRKDGTVQL